MKIRHAQPFSSVRRAPSSVRSASDAATSGCMDSVDAVARVPSLERRLAIGLTEQVRTARRETHDDRVARTLVDLSRDLHGELFAARQSAVQEARRPELFGKLDRCGQPELVRAATAHAYVLRTDAERDA